MRLLFLLASFLAAVVALPNIVVFVADDQGYGDMGHMGHPTIETPHLDSLASEGMRFTQWMSANAVCTPARAALLTGRLAVRTGMTSTLFQVFTSPAQPGGLPDNATTLAEYLRPLGYRSAAIGKWHLGVNARRRGDGAHLPTRHGFDMYYGFPVTNNPRCAPPAPDPLRCLVMRGTTVVEQPAVLETLPARLTAEAVAWVAEAAAAGAPFFLYYAFVQPHTPLFASPKFQGKSRRGAYGDALLDVDDSVGQVMAAIRAAGVDDNTYVFYTSDNGGWLEEGLDGGSNGLLRGGKSQAYEGGIRVPAIAWGAGVQHRVSHALVSSLDIVPTVLELVGLTNSTELDGVSMVSVLQGGADSDLPSETTRFLYHYCGYVLHAMRYGQWKAFFLTPRTTARDTCIYFPTWQVNGCMCSPEANHAHDPPLLYNLNRDVEEQFPVLPSDTEYASVLAAVLAEKERHEAGVVHVRSEVLALARPWLQPCCNPPLCRCSDP